MIRLAGKPPLPIAGPLFGARHRRAAPASGWPSCPPDFRRLLRYGRGGRHHAGWSRRSASRPRYTTRGRGRGLRAAGHGATRRWHGRAPAAVARDAPPALPARAARGARRRARAARGGRRARPPGLPGGARDRRARRPRRLDGRLPARTSGASTRSSPSSVVPAASTSSTTAGGGCRRPASRTCPRTAARCWRPTTPASCPWDATMMSVGDPARAPAAALPALPRAQLGLRPALRLDLDPQGRRRGGLAATTPCACSSRTSSWRSSPRASRARASPSPSATGSSASAAAASWRSRCAPARRSCPVAVVGSEEIYPKLGESGAARAPDAARPTSRSRPPSRWLGPLGVVPLPSKWRIEFCEPIDDRGLRARGGRRPRAGARAVRAGARRRSSRRSTRTWWSGARRSSEPTSGFRSRSESAGRGRARAHEHRRDHGADSCATRRRRSGSSSRTSTWS